MRPERLGVVPVELPRRVDGITYSVDASIEHFDHRDCPLDEVWLEAGKLLQRIEGAVQWWIGDWWAYGADREYGDGAQIAAKIGMKYGTITTYASVARAFTFSNRLENLSFTHHLNVMAADENKRQAWLTKAGKKKW